MKITKHAQSTAYVSPALYGRVTLLVGLAYLITTSDTSVATVALKSVGEGLHAPPAMLTWVISATALALAGFLSLGGRVSDIHGQRICFLFGISLFGLGSCASAMATGIDVLIATRILQGIGGAFLIPSSFSLINTLLPEGKARHRALGIMGIMQGLSVVIGLVLGGIVATSLGWRLCFLINLPLAAAAFLLAYQVIPKAEPAREKRAIDFLGAILISLAIALVIIALSDIPAHGLVSFQGLGVLACGLAVFLAFFLHEGWSASPLIPLAIFRAANIIGANLAMLCLLAAGIGIFILFSSFMQIVLGFSAMVTGIAMVPYAAGLSLGGRAAHALMARWSAGIAGNIGFAILFLGVVILAWGAQRAPGYWLDVLPGMVVSGVGIMITTVALIASGTAAVPARQQGIASGLIMTSNQIGIAIGASLTLTILGSGDLHLNAAAAFNRTYIALAIIIALGAAIQLTLIRTGAAPDA